MNTPGIEFGRKTSAAYAALCKPLCQKLHLPHTAFDILMFLPHNPAYQTARGGGGGAGSTDSSSSSKIRALLGGMRLSRPVLP